MITIQQLTEDLARIIALRAPASDKIRQAYYRDRIIQPGMAYAVLEGDMPVIAGGVMPVWEDRAEGWSTVLPVASRRARVIGTRHAAALLETLIEAGRFSRIDVFLHPDTPWCTSFGNALGLSHQGLFRVYSKVAHG